MAISHESLRELLKIVDGLEQGKLKVSRRGNGGVLEWMF